MQNFLKHLFSLEDPHEQCALFETMEHTKPTVTELIDCVNYIQEFQVFPLSFPHTLEIVGTGGS